MLIWPAFGAKGVKVWTELDEGLKTEALVYDPKPLLKLKYETTADIQAPLVLLTTIRSQTEDNSDLLKQLTWAGFLEAPSFVNPNTGNRVTLWYKRTEGDIEVKYSPDQAVILGFPGCCALFIAELPQDLSEVPEGHLKGVSSGRFILTLNLPTTPERVPLLTKLGFELFVNAPGIEIWAKRTTAPECEEGEDMYDDDDCDDDDEGPCDDPDCGMCNPSPAEGLGE